jgi:ribosomal protein S18 acetylase RimI-like enzyme
MLDGLIIRNAVEADLPEVVALWWKLAAYEESIKQHPQLKNEATCRAEMLDVFSVSLQLPQFKFLVAEYQKSVIGYLYGWLQTNIGISCYPLYLQTGSVYVEEQYRHNGICSLLMQAMETFARANKVPYISLTMISQNADAQKAYSKLGYTVTDLELKKWL